MLINRNQKLEILPTVSEIWTLWFSLYKNRKLKVKLWSVGACERKKSAFFVTFYLKGNFFNTFVMSQYILYWITFRTYILLHIKKHYFIHFCRLSLKSSKAFSEPLSCALFKDLPFKNSFEIPHDSFVLNGRTICKTKQNTNFVLWFERTIQKTGFTIFLWLLR